MNTYFPQFRAMWMAENSTNTLHNILTLRGAQVRDPLKWASYLNETIDLYGDRHRREVPEPSLADVGQRQDHRLLEEAARLYKYIHDQSVNLMNKGYTGVEISNMVKLPPELDKQWYNRGYYGTRAATTRAPSISATWASTTAIRRRSTNCRRRKPPRNMSSTWAARRPSCRRPRRTSTRANTAGSRKRSSKSSLPTRTTRMARNCSPTPTSRWAIRPSPARGARSICKARTSCATACRLPAASTPPAPTPSRRCRPR